MYHHILFATDLAAETSFLIPKVQEIQKLTQAKLTIIHVVEPFHAYSDMYYGIEELQQQLVQEAQKKLAELAGKLSITAGNQLVKIGYPKRIIHETAEQLDVDLIVCGSHGRHGISLLLGSTANAVLHSAVCDVLMVRFPEPKK